MTAQTNNGLEKSQTPRISLAGVRKERLSKPTRILLYGVEGIGKSTFAAQSPDPIFVCAEDGTSELDVCRYPVEPKTWTDILDAIRVVGSDDRAFKTLVIDTVDWAEPLCWAHVCKESGWKSIEAPGYGRGYSAALDQWRWLLSRLDQLRATRNMNILLLGHSVIKTFNNPEGDNYDRYQPKLNDKAAGLLKEWADCVFFATYETYTVDKGTKKRGVSSGARVIHTQRSAAFDAKNHYSLPETLALDWNDFAAAWGAAQVASPATLRTRIDALLGDITDVEFVDQARAIVSSARDDSKKLSAIENKVAARLSKQQKE